MLERIKPMKNLVNEMLDRLPESIWTSDSTTFLDTAIGGGQFVKEIESRLRKYGHSDANIKNRVYGFEYNQGLIDLAVNMYNLKGQYSKLQYKDLFRSNMSKEFDLVAGNPPYQPPKKGDYSFWARFVDTNHRFLKPNAYLMMVIPAGWMSPTNDIRQGKKSVLRDIFSKENTTYINIDPDLGKKHFPGVGQKFTWFLLQKGTYNSTKIDFGTSSIHVDLSKIPMLAKETDAINIKILEKLTNLSTKWEFTRYIMKESWDDVSFTSSPQLFPRINGNTNHLETLVYTKSACKFQKNKKVVLPYNGSNYNFVVDNGNLGCTNAYVMLLQPTDEIQSAAVYFNCPLIKWLGKNKFTQYNEGALINSVSKIDLSQKLTNKDIYNFYNLTEEEIKYVEEKSC